ncbi:hypothetical protein ABZT26_35205 [Streptomyces sp. NPDC005395]|uniref:hypothetical protein n=1 Tax=Streptomyces sp. NPDC005395 TaxID=3157042 RepID=UPI0033BE8714
MSDDVATPVRAQTLPHRNRLTKALKALDVDVPERKPGQPQNPMGERGDAAQLLGAMAAMVEQMHMPLRGGPLHADVQKGYLGGYERDVPAIFAQLGDRAKYDEAFVRQGVEQVPHASQQLVMAAVAFGVAHKSMLAASLIAGGLDDLTAESADAIEKLTLEAAEYADMLTKYVEEKRPFWNGEADQA